MLAAIEANLVGPGVERVIHLRTMHLGPEELLVGAKLAMPPDATLAEVAQPSTPPRRGCGRPFRPARVIYLEPDLDR